MRFSEQGMSADKYPFTFLHQIVFRVYFAQVLAVSCGACIAQSGAMNLFSTRRSSRLSCCLSCSPTNRTPAVGYIKLTESFKSACWIFIADHGVSWRVAGYIPQNGAFQPDESQVCRTFTVTCVNGW